MALRSGMLAPRCVAGGNCEGFGVRASKRESKHGCDFIVLGDLGRIAGRLRKTNLHDSH